jgi:hypothetical protein
MKRLSPIIVAFLLLALATSGGIAYGLLRLTVYRAGPFQSPVEAPVTWETGSRVPSTARLSGMAFAPKPATSLGDASLKDSDVVPTSASDDQSAAKPPEPPSDEEAMNRVRAEFLRLRHADEAVFETLKISEDHRLAIRMITATVRPRRRPADADASDAVAQNRWTAIESLLGAQAANEFRTAESAAIRGLTEQAADPPVLPDAGLKESPER